MTLPVERTRALLKAEALLKGLAGHGPTYSRAEARELARSALRHFPTAYDIDRLAELAHDILADVSEVA